MKTQIIISGLTIGDPYFLRYSARNAHGWSEPSTVYYTLMATEPDQIIPSLSRTANVGTDIVVNWDASGNSHGSTVTAYRITIISKHGLSLEFTDQCNGSL